MSCSPSQTRAPATFLVLVTLSWIAIPSFVRADEKEQSKDSTKASPPGHGPTLISLEFSYYGFSELANPEVGTFEEDLQVSMMVTAFKGGIPTPFKNETIIMVNSLFFEQRHLLYRGWDFDVTPRSEQPLNFYAIGWEFSLLAELKERIWLVTQLSWGLFSDLKDVDQNDDRIYGLILASFTLRNDLTLGVGLSYNPDFGVPAPIPLAQLSYQHRWFRVEAILPSEGELLFIPHERTEIGFRGRVSGNEFRATNRVNPLLNNFLVQISTIDLGAAANFRFVKGLWFGLFAGGSVRNRYKAVQPNGDRAFDISVRNSWVVSGRLFYRL